MTELNLWRGIAAAATLGWAGTAIAWTWSQDATPEPSEHVVTRVRPSVPTQAIRPTEAVQPRALLARGPTRPDPVDTEALREEVRAEVVEELKAEREERHREHEERRMNRMLDEVATFARENDLDEDTQGALEEAMLAMHDRMQAMRPEGPPPPGGPTDEMRAAFDRSFEQLDQDVSDAIGDLAPAFHEWMRPPGPPR